jgi:phosphoglycolate phosphatase-like HAD superfamily hydrolase
MDGEGKREGEQQQGASILGAVLDLDGTLLDTVNPCLRSIFSCVVICILRNLCMNMLSTL